MAIGRRLRSVKDKFNNMANPDIYHYTSGINQEEVLLGEHKVIIETSQNGEKLDVSDRVEESYHGPRDFDVVVNFGGTFVAKGMKSTRVSEEDQWGLNNPPPEGISILEFVDPTIKEAVACISDIATTDFYGDPKACSEYYRHNQHIFRSIAERSGFRPQDARVLGLVRAGLVAGEMVGVSYTDQVLIQTKRLPLKGETPGDIGIGISYFEPRQMKQLDGADVIIPDPAGATFASVVANLTYLRHKGIVPRRVDIWNVVTSHKGSLFALEAMRELEIFGGITAGGYAPEMNDHYYLVSKNGQPSVRDAGDALNGCLPDHLKSRS